MKTLKLTCFGIAMVLFGFFAGKLYEQQSNISPKTQTSIYQHSGYTSELVEQMCEAQGIDYKNGKYLFTCPKCITGGAHQKQNKEFSVYFRWYTDYPVVDKLSPGETAMYNGDYGQTYCGKCYYPIGTDWKLIDLGS